MKELIKRETPFKLPRVEYKEWWFNSNWKYNSNKRFISEIRQELHLTVQELWDDNYMLPKSKVIYIPFMYKNYPIFLYNDIFNYL